LNEAETRAERIDPKLRSGWGVVEGSKILRERLAQITDGRSKLAEVVQSPLIDYILVYKGIKLLWEAKSDELELEKVSAQAKLYAEKIKP
jgi:type I site-specific restriction endonuclease